MRGSKLGNRRAHSSVGRAPARQAGGHWFEPSCAHFSTFSEKFAMRSIAIGATFARSGKALPEGALGMGADGRGQGRYVHGRAGTLFGLVRLSVLVSLLALVAPATAQATFQQTGRLSPSEQGARTPQVAVGSNGNAGYVWAHYDGTDPDGTDAQGSQTCCWRIEGRTRSATGTLGPVLQLSAAGKNAAE